MTACLCSKGGECFAWPPDRNGPVCREWERRTECLAVESGLTFHQDPVGGGFYSKAGIRLSSDSECERLTYENLARALSVRRKS